MSNNATGSTSTRDQAVEDDWKSFVGSYQTPANYPFELGDTVWIVKPEYRTPLGEFIIMKAHPNKYFELARKADRVPHPELVAETHLTRDPYAPQ